MKFSRNTAASTVILGFMVVSLVVAALQLPSIRLQNDLETWLADDDKQAQALQRLESYFPKEERIIVSWDSSSFHDPRNQQLTERLLESPYFSQVRTAFELVSQMVNWKVDESEAIKRLSGVLIGQSSPESSQDESGVDPHQPNVSTLLTLSEAGTANPALAVQEIHAAAVAVGIPSTELHIAGSLVTSLAVDREVWISTWNMVDPLQHPPVFAISAVAGILLAFAVLRSVRVGLMVTCSAWWTAVVTTALMPATGHTMNMVTIVMPTLLVVLTVSASIHIANYWKHATSVGAIHPVISAIRMGFRPCLLASVTTSVGLLSLAISQLGPIRDFGVFSTVGTMLSLIVVVVAFPAMLWLSGMKASPLTSENAVWRSVALFVCRHRKMIVLSSTLLGVGMAFGLQWLKTEVEVGRYFPDTSRLVQDSQFFEQNIGGTSSVDIIVHYDESYPRNLLFLERMELIREIEDELKRHPAVTGAISLADFQPVTQRPGPEEPQSRRLKYTLRSRRTESKVKNSEAKASREYLAVAIPVDENWTLKTPLDETWRISVQLLLEGNSEYGNCIQDLHRIADAKLAGMSGVWFDVTGSVPVFFSAQTALLNSLMRSLGLAFFIIAVAMIVLLRSVTAGLISSTLGLLPIAVVFGLMSWMGYVLDIGTMLTGSVAMGIAVDDMLHLLTWFRVSIREGHSREESVVRALHHCGSAMTQTTLVIGLSLLLLYPADLLLISRFGWVMAALLGMAWLSSILLLPALLAGKLGQLIERQS